MKKLTRIDGTHHHCRLGNGVTIPFQPFLGDPDDGAPHNIVDDDTAKKVLSMEKGQYEVENIPEPKAKPAKTEKSEKAEV